MLLKVCDTPCCSISDERYRFEYLQRLKYRSKLLSGLSERLVSLTPFFTTGSYWRPERELTL